MRLAPSLLALLVACCLASAPASAAQRQDMPTLAPAVWDPQEIATVVERGILGPTVSDFRPDQPLTRGSSPPRSQRGATRLPLRPTRADA